jgi:hypothetical protein
MYKVRLIYSTASHDITSYYGDERMDRQYQPSPDILRLFGQVPKLELKSNELALEFMASDTKKQPTNKAGE